jgi:hypothetical protein
MQHIKEGYLYSLQPGYGNDATVFNAQGTLNSDGTGAAPSTCLGNNSLPTSNGNSKEQTKSGGSKSIAKRGVRKTAMSSAAAKVSIQESRKRYRERIKKEAMETQEKFERVAGEIARLKLEQEQLHCENTVLEIMCRYSESAVNLIRNAAASISTLATDSAWHLKGAAHASMMAIYGELTDTVWEKLLRPSDEQLLKLAKQQGVLSTNRETFVDRLWNVIAEWNSASPAAREIIERKIHYAFETRGRVVRLLLREHPNMIVSAIRFSRTENENQPLSIGGLGSIHSDPRTAVVKRDALFNSEDIIRATLLTEEQRIALLRYWKIYVTHFKKSKGIVEDSTATIDNSMRATKTGALAHEPVGSLYKIATSHIQLQQTSTSLEELSQDEIFARVHLALGCLSVLRPLQLAYFVLMSIPNLDMICDIVTVYKSLLRMEGAAFAVKHDYEITGTTNDGTTNGSAGESGAVDVAALEGGVAE